MIEPLGGSWWCTWPPPSRCARRGTGRGSTPRRGPASSRSSRGISDPYEAPDDAEIWGAGGYGAGELALAPEGATLMKAAINWRMASAGLRSDLFTFGGGTTQAVVSDALWATTGSDRVRGLVATDAGVSRLRLGLEGSRRFALPGGGCLTPKVEIGARHDGGDAETGFGVEVGGGVALTAPRLGLKLDLEGRTLVSHQDGGMRDRGFSASLAYDPRPDSPRGLLLALRQDVGGRASGGLDALFAQDPLALHHGGAGAAHWSAEMGYGLPAFQARFIGIPHVDYGVSYGAREIGLGWRLEPARNAAAVALSLAVKTTRRESSGREPADNRGGIEVRARW